MANSRIELLKSYIKEDPSDAFSLFALALEYVKLGNDTEAKQLMEMLYTNQPDYLANYYHYGKLLERIGEHQKSIHIYSQGESIAFGQKNIKTMNELRSAREELE